MPGWLRWVSREAGCQPGWPQGGLGEETWGCPAEQGLIGVSYTCFSGVFKTVFPPSFRLLLCWGLVWGKCLYPLSPLPTMDLAPSHLPIMSGFAVPPCSLPQDPGARQSVPACGVSPYPKYPPEPLGSHERRLQHGSVQETRIPEVWVPCRGAPGMAGPGELGLMGVCPVPAEEEDPSFWNKQAAAAIEASFTIQPRIRQAKNLILFLGDGESHWHPWQAG